MNPGTDRWNSPVPKCFFSNTKLQRINKFAQYSRYSQMAHKARKNFGDTN